MAEGRAGSLTRAAALGLLLLVAPLHSAPKVEVLQPGKLTACLPRNAGVIAGKRSTGGTGFDYRIVEELAARLGLTLEPVWFAAELEEESDPLRDTYAVLSYGLCDVVPGHPRYVRAVGAPGYARAAVPRWIGMAQEMDRDTDFFQDIPVGFVDVAPIAVTRGYMRSTIGLVYRDGTAEPQGLGDLDGRSLAFQQGTLSGAIAMTRLSAEERRHARHYNPGPSFLWMAETEGADVALVDVIAFDTYRASNPGTQFRLADWRHPLGMDIGLAVLERNDGLLQALDAALAEIMAEGQAETLAAREGMTYTPPEGPDLAPEITMRDLLGGR